MRCDHATVTGINFEPFIVCVCVKPFHYSLYHCVWRNTLKYAKMNELFSEVTVMGAEISIEIIILTPLKFEIAIVRQILLA